MEIGIDQYNGHGFRVFRIITATKVRLMDPELEKTTIAKGPDRSSNMAEEKCELAHLLSFCTVYVYLHRAFQRSWGRRMLNFTLKFTHTKT